MTFMAFHLHIVHHHCSANDHTRLARRPKTSRIATNCSAAACTSLHLFLASPQLNCAVFLGLPDPFTATSPCSLHFAIFPHSHCRTLSAPSSLSRHLPCQPRLVAFATLVTEHAVAYICDSTTTATKIARAVLKNFLSDRSIRLPWMVATAPPQAWIQRSPEMTFRRGDRP